MRRLLSVGFSKETGIAAASGVGLSVSFSVLVFLLTPSIALIADADTLITLLIAAVFFIPLVAIIAKRRCPCSRACEYSTCHAQ